MNVALWQLVLAVSIPTSVAMIGLLFSFVFNNRLADRIDATNDRIDKLADKLADRIDRQTENFNNQVTTLLTTIHSVDVRVVRLEEKDK